MKSLLRSPKGQIGAIVGGGLLVALAVWFLLVTPQKTKASNLESQISTSRGELSQKRLALARPSAEVNVKASDLYRLTKALPNDAGMSDILLDVNRLAGRNDLDFRAIAPGTPVLGSGYLQQPLEVVLLGRFANVSRFLGDLRTLVSVKRGRLDARGRLYSVTQVDLTEPGNSLKFPVVQAKVTLNAFSFSAPTPAATPDPSTPTADASSSGTVAAGATP